MTRFAVKALTRDSFVVEYDGDEFIVSGERGNDGVWDVFPKMVYQPVPDGRTKFVDDESLKAAIVAALVANWKKYGYDYTLNLIED